MVNSKQDTDSTNLTEFVQVCLLSHSQWELGNRVEQPSYPQEECLDSHCLTQKRAAGVDLRYAKGKPEALHLWLGFETKEISANDFR